MVDFRILVGYDGALGRIAEQLEANTTAALATAIDRSKSRLEIEVLPLVNEEPPPSDGVAPFWASRRQQQAYFASDGFGKGIPYERSDKLLQAWQAFTVLSGLAASIGIENTAPSAKFVYGTWYSILPQQLFHFMTGWEPVFPKRDTVIATIAAIVFEELQQQLPLVILGVEY